MNPKKMIDMNNLNWWLVLAGIGLNLILATAIALLSNTLALRGDDQATAVISQTTFMLGTFLATFFTGFITGRMSNDDNGVTYGLVCSVSVLVVVVIAGGLSVYTLMMVLIALAGGFNGGMMSMRRGRPRSR
ncbi:MAG: hypothetical protein GX620_10255 [Chloroflexi bacterium]|nr:hypothetical protein [Chloroflexota bacterium]